MFKSKLDPDTAFRTPRPQALVKSGSQGRCTQTYHKVLPTEARTICGAPLKEDTRTVSKPSSSTSQLCSSCFPATFQQHQALSAIALGHVFNRSSNGLRMPYGGKGLVDNEDSVFWAYNQGYAFVPQGGAQWMLSPLGLAVYEQLWRWGQ